MAVRQVALARWRQAMRQLSEVLASWHYVILVGKKERGVVRMMKDSVYRCFRVWHDWVARVRYFTGLCCAFTGLCFGFTVVCCGFTALCFAR
jgi:hypothetical protein